MRKIKRNIGLIVLGFLFGIFLFSGTVFAATNYQSGQNVVLAKGETIDTDYFATGSNVFLDGTVNGDAYVAGGNITINGTVNGDVIAAGGNIHISGTVVGNVRCVGGQVTISGNIGRNISIAGGSFMIENPARVAGSVTAVGGNITILAPVAKGSTLAGGQANINTSIGGDVNAAVANLSILPQTTIGGNLLYWSSQKASISPGAKIQGQTQFHEKKEKQPQNVFGFLTGIYLFWTLISLLSAFLIGLFFLYFFPVFTEQTMRTIITRPWISLGVGILAAILFPMIFLLLLVTVFGIPLALILLLIFILFAYISKVFVGFAIGEILLHRHTVWSLLLGLLIYEVIAFIPFIGWIFSTLAFFVGFGSLLLSQRYYYNNLRVKKLL